MKKVIFSFFYLVLLFLSFIYNVQIIKFIESERVASLDNFMIFITDVGFVLLLAALSMYLLYKEMYKEFILMVVVSSLSLETAYILKKIFQIPRPFIHTDVAVNPLTYATGYAFPSIHAAFCFSIVPFIQKIFKKKWPVFVLTFILFLIAVSRLYVGVHYLRDIIIGGTLGYIYARSILFFQDKYQIFEWFSKHFHGKLEVRRQIAHMATGITIILLIKLRLLNITFLFIILLFGGIVSLASRYYKLPFIYDILRYFERPRELKTFPGRGSFFLVLGSFLSLLLFEEQIALAAIAIMSVGDSVTTLVGTYFGMIKNPLNPKKHLEGTFLAITLSTIAAYNFVSFEKALFASTIAMIFEVFSIRYIDRIFDDNILIPLIAGAVMAFGGALIF